MRYRRASTDCAAMLAMAVAWTLGTPPGHAQPYAPETETVPQVVRSHAATFAGVADPRMRMHIGISLPMRHMNELIALVAAQQNPRSHEYRRYLSVDDFTRRFGPSESDYAAVQHYFASFNLHVSAATRNRYMIDVDGPLADIERAVGVRLSLYEAPNESRRFVAPDGEPRLALSVAINHISGLDDYVQPYARIVRPASPVQLSVRPTGSGPRDSFTGADMRAAYYGARGLTGAGQSIGLFEFGGWNPKDVDLYFKELGATTAVPVVGVSVDGVAVNCTGCQDGEQVSDITYAMSVAPGATQVQVYVGGAEYDIFEQMATDNTSKQLSVSWGLDPGEKAAEEPLYLEMAAQGQTLLTASGDASSLSASDPWPEESAYITGVGGTELETSAPGGPWLSEIGWGGSAGGPALDPTILIPSYQAPFVIPLNRASPTLRNVPDVSANASGLYSCENGICFGGFAGTSFSSPIWAGLVALANQKAAMMGQPPIGFLNPTVYRLALSEEYFALFHDPSRGKSGINIAVPGYDLVTGLGTATRSLVANLPN